MEITKQMDEIFCHSCGNIIKKEAEICPKCGVRQNKQVQVGNKNKLVAGLLALFLGGIGIHKFYLGKMGTGIVYILFCWTMIPALIAFFEAIMLFVMEDDVFNQKYNKN